MSENFGPDELRGRVTSLAGLVEYQQGAIVSRVLLRAAAGSVTLFAFDCGQELSEHTTPFDALVQVVEGEGQIVIAGESHLVRAGEAIIMPADVPHAVGAAVRFKMILTMVRA